MPPADGCSHPCQGFPGPAGMLGRAEATIDIHGPVCKPETPTKQPWSLASRRAKLLLLSGAAVVLCVCIKVPAAVVASRKAVSANQAAGATHRAPVPPVEPPKLQLVQQQLLFADDFLTLDRSTWNLQLGDGSDYGLDPGWGNGELQCYTASPGNVVIVANPNNATDRVLRIRTVYSATPQPCINQKAPPSVRNWTSARVNTQGIRTFQPIVSGQQCTPMSIKARIMFPGKNGQWGAFWVMGSEGKWPTNGEIDIIEHTNKDEYVLGTVHFANVEGKHQQWPPEPHNRFPLPNAVGSWNVYWVDWGCDFIRWLVNGEQKQEISKSQVNVWSFDKPFYILLNMAVGGALPTASTGVGDSGIDTSGGDMLVDYVRVYTMGPA